MEIHRLGNTGIELSAIGFGCGGNAELMVGEDEELRTETIRTALAHGVAYFDTAASYGDGLSEEHLGKALRTMDANPVISDKVILFDNDLVDPKSAVLRCFEGSMKRLGRERVDALILHNRVFNTIDPSMHMHGALLTLDHVFGTRGVASAFDELKSEGRVRTVGFTSLGGDLDAIYQMIDSGAFGAINVSLNFLNPSACMAVPSGFLGRDNGRVVERAAKAGLGVMAIQVLARGALTGAGPSEGHAREVAAIALEFGDKLEKVAIRYVLSKPGVSTVIVGFSQPRHVLDAVEAFDAGPLDATAVDEIERVALSLGGGWDR